LIVLLVLQAPASSKGIAIKMTESERVLRLFISVNGVKIP
jgi:hypothetical protein